ncbi:hypothetical protein D7F82_14705 [Salmonella enterica]|nr:hypothetical protein [Salmonella enterica subsp. enterica serovar Albany]EAS8087415.1 hypothetical protein [Salmonella enterica]EAU2902143.1 hypothetical protein [Salmonella enterica subsp. enterica serovar Albany]GCE73307.1 hypothetical protein SEA27A368_31400 [Salmonella enterica]
MREAKRGNYHATPGVILNILVILQVACAAAAFPPPVTYFSKLPEIRSLAAFLQLELFRVYR